MQIQSPHSYTKGYQGITSPKFGWGGKHGPLPEESYMHTLTLNDFRGNKTLNDIRQKSTNPIPSNDLVRRVVKSLVGDSEAKSDDVPRVAVIKNTLYFLKTRERVIEFQKNLHYRVGKMLALEYPDLVLPKDPKKRSEMLNQGLIFEPDELQGYGGNTETASYKSPHIDDTEWSLNCNAYGPNINIDKGFPLFADARQLARDLRQPGKRAKLWGNVIGWEEYDGNPSHVPRILPKHDTKIKKDYSIILDNLDMENDIPIAIYLNSPGKAGLLHGAIPPKRIDKSRPAQRPIHSIGMVRSKSNDLSEYYESDELNTMGDPRYVFYRFNK